MRSNEMKIKTILFRI